MTNFEVAKKIVNVVVGFSTSYVVGSALKNNATPTTPIQRVETEVGAFVLGYIASELTQKYAESKMNEISDWWHKNVKKS